MLTYRQLHVLDETYVINQVSVDSLNTQVTNGGKVPNPQPRHNPPCARPLQAPVILKPDRCSEKKGGGGGQGGNAENR